MILEAEQAEFDVNQKKFLGSRFGKQGLGLTDGVVLDLISVWEIKEAGLSKESHRAAMFVDSSLSLR